VIGLHKQTGIASGDQGQREGLRKKTRDIDIGAENRDDEGYDPDGHSGNEYKASGWIVFLEHI
jgi:hypothetical protein